MNSHDDLLLKLGRDRVLAHQVLFAHRHPDTTPPFHYAMLRDWNSQLPLLNTMAFREGGKSTAAEESITLGAEYRSFHNAVIVGSTEKRACERLEAVKHELSTNELLEELFGEVSERTCHTWNEAEIILPGGHVRLAAIGRGQSIRGTKYHQWRPDLLFCDDIEEVERGQVYSDEEAAETVRWFYKVLLPACDQKRVRVRVNATPLSRQSLPMVLARDPAWTTRVYPIEYVDPQGERQATWPSRYPLAWIDDKRESFARVGLLNDYMQEYMCVAEDPKAKIFTREMFRVEPRVRTWQPTYAMFDPARTVKATSATTGWAVWSWIANRMVVWDGGGDLWKPDELVARIFEVAERWNPVVIGVEEDGLNEWLMQPLRHEMARRNLMLPIEPKKAPKGKIAFIEGLQPFFLAKEVTLAQQLDTLVSQFLGFPAGRIDGPNALAYAPRMRPGLVVYDNFSAANVVEELAVRPRSPVWLCLNAASGLTTGVVVQLVDGALHVLADHVREGDPGAALSDVVSRVAVEQGAPRLLAGLRHWSGYDRLGLRGAVAKLPAELRRGGAENVGRDEIRALLGKTVRGQPALLVAHQAAWTLNGLSAGYAREVDKRGHLADEAKDGVYRVLIEGLEAFAALLKVGISEDRGVPNVRVTEGGQRYVSALPGKTAPLPSKDDFLRAGAVTGVEHLRSARR